MPEAVRGVKHNNNGIFTHSMRIQHFIIINALVLTGLFAVSCSKSPSEPTDLGIVELSPRTPKRVSLGADKECLMLLIMQPDGNLRIEMAVEIRTADGKTNRVGQARLIARSGQQCALSVGDTMIALTPTLKTQ